MNKDVCLIWKGHITEINDDTKTFEAEIFNVVENTTKECAVFEFSDIKGSLKIGKTFWWVVTSHGSYLQFMEGTPMVIK